LVLGHQVAIQAQKLKFSRQAIPQLLACKSTCQAEPLTDFFGIQMMPPTGPLLATQVPWGSLIRFQAINIMQLLRVVAHQLYMPRTH